MYLALVAATTTRLKARFYLQQSARWVPISLCFMSNFLSEKGKLCHEAKFRLSYYH